MLLENTILFMQVMQEVILSEVQEETKGTVLGYSEELDHEDAAVIADWQAQNFSLPAPNPFTSDVNADMDNARKMPLPPLDFFQQALSEKKLFLSFVDNIVENIAYWIIQHMDIKSREAHCIYRDRLAAEYPNILQDKCIQVRYSIQLSFLVAQALSDTHVLEVFREL